MILFLHRVIFGTKGNPTGVAPSGSIGQPIGLLLALTKAS